MLTVVTVQSHTAAPRREQCSEQRVVAIDGSPVVERVVLCDLGSLSSTCGHGGDRGDTNGRSEADVVHGVFSELALEGLVVPMTPGSLAMQQADAESKAAAKARCEAKRQQLLDKVGTARDPWVRRDALAAMPTCS